MTVAGGEQVTLDVADVPVQEQDMRLFARFLHGLLDPNLAFVFFWGGLALIVLEFFTPGGVLGTIGAVMLVSSLVALGMLPFQLIGVVFLIASVVFFVLELKHPGVGLPAVAGIVCLVLGRVVPLRHLGPGDPRLGARHRARRGVRRVLLPRRRPGRDTAPAAGRRLPERAAGRASRGRWSATSGPSAS